MTKGRKFAMECLEPRHLLAVSGVIWHDQNGDGLRSSNEPVVVGATVQMLNAQALVTASTPTGADGSYIFPNVAPGSYRLQLAAEAFQAGGMLAGFQVTLQRADVNPSLDSDFVPETRQTNVFAVALGAGDTTLDGGLYLPARITGATFHDLEGDGYRAANESGQAGVTVRLQTASVQSRLSSGGQLSRPIDVARGDDGSLYVVNVNTPRIVRVDPRTGEQTFIYPRGRHLISPISVAMNADGKLLVVDLVTKNVASVDFRTAVTSVIASGGEISRPTGIAVEADGSILLTIADTRKLVRIDPASGEQQVLSVRGEMRWPTAVDVAADGQIFVADWRGKVIRIDPITGAQHVVATGTDLAEATGLTVGANGELFVVARKERKVFRIDSVTGNRLFVAEDGGFTQPGGLVVNAKGDLIIADETADHGVGAVFRVSPRNVVGQVATPAGGEFSFSDLYPGRYELFTLPRAGWTLTTPNPQTFQVNSGELENRQIGSFARVSLSGTKFHDRNGDGIRNGAESGQSGWTVFLDLNHNGVPSLGEPSTVTASDGSFVFRDIGPGTYQILTRQVNGWQPSHAPISITFDSSSNVTGIELGSVFGGAMGEVGMISNLDHVTQTIPFQRVYEKPVVIANTVTVNGGSPTIARILDV